MLSFFTNRRLIAMTGAVALALVSSCTTTPASTPAPKSGFVSVPGGPVWYEVMGDGNEI